MAPWLYRSRLLKVQLLEDGDGVDLVTEDGWYLVKLAPNGIMLYGSIDEGLGFALNTEGELLVSHE